MHYARVVPLLVILAVALPGSPTWWVGDDAGSGGDAPAGPSSTIRVLADTVYEGVGHAFGGTMTLGAVEDSDWYLFEGTPGTRISAAAWPATCPYWYDSEGGQITPPCLVQYSEENPLTERANATLPANGRAFLVIPSTVGESYRFIIGTHGQLHDPAPPRPGPESLGPGPDPVCGSAAIVPDCIPAEANARDAACQAGLAWWVCSPVPPVGNDPTCGGATASEPTPTHGSGDPNVPSLAWAALKTGFRAVVAWDTADPVVGRLTYSLDGGDTASVEDATARTHHVFVIENLPVGRTLCFSTWDESGASQAHAVRLANAMNAYDERAGAYSVNLLAVANQQPAAQQAVQDSFDGFATKLWDATDGHVRAGRIILLHADVEHEGGGAFACFEPINLGKWTADTANSQRDYLGREVPVPSMLHPWVAATRDLNDAGIATAIDHASLGCGPADVVYTHDSQPHASAMTWYDGIADPAMAIWMNSAFEETVEWLAPTTGWLERVNGMTLVHELGHYAFGMDDLYHYDPCYDEATGISIMGSGYGKREFDDEVARCPVEPEGYIPSWTLAQMRFDRLPDRPNGPASGPFGDGGAYSLHVYEFDGVDLPP